jgi:hypothetical protein
MRSGCSIASLATAAASLTFEGGPSPAQGINISHQPNSVTAPPAQVAVACGQDPAQAPMRVLPLGSDGGSSTASIAGSAAAMASAHHQG